MFGILSPILRILDKQGTERSIDCFGFIYGLKLHLFSVLSSEADFGRTCKGNHTSVFDDLEGRCDQGK